MPKLELAWAAGFFDGEGSTVTQKGGHGLCLAIVNTNKAMLERFQKAIAAGNISGPYTKARNRKPIYFLNVYGKQRVPEVIRNLWPFLSEEKQLQAAHAIMRSDNRLIKKKGHNIVPWGREYAPSVET